MTHVKPVRLERKEEFDLKKFLNQELTFKVKYYFLLGLFAIIVLLVGFISKGATYGYF